MFYKVIFAITLIIPLVSAPSLNASSSVQPENEVLSDQPEQGKIGIIQRTPAELGELRAKLAKISTQFEAERRAKLKKRKEQTPWSYPEPVRLRTPCVLKVQNTTEQEDWKMMDAKERLTHVSFQMLTPSPDSVDAGIPLETFLDLSSDITEENFELTLR